MRMVLVISDTIVMVSEQCQRPPLPLLPQRSEQTITFFRVLRKFLVGLLLDVVTDRQMKFVRGYRAHAVEVFAEVPGGIVDFPIRESSQGDF